MAGPVQGESGGHGPRCPGKSPGGRALTQPAPFSFEAGCKGGWQQQERVVETSRLADLRVSFLLG